MIEMRIEFKKAKGNKIVKLTKGRIEGEAEFVEDEMLEALKAFDKADSDTLRLALIRFCDYKENEEAEEE